jgi:hypothetical protein
MGLGLNMLRKGLVDSGPMQPQHADAACPVQPGQFQVGSGE